MNVVELEQKKALLVKFSKGESVGSTIDQIKNDTSEIIKSLGAPKSRSGLSQYTTMGISLPPVTAEPVPATVVKKVTVDKVHKTPAKITSPQKELAKKTAKVKAKTAIKADITQAKKETQKPAKQTAIATKSEQKVRQKAKPAESRPESAKEDLTKVRKNEGFFKGIRSSIMHAFKKQGDADKKRDSKLGKALESDDAKEPGMLALLGPIAPAIQELKSLRGERDEDEPSRISKIVGKFRKKPVEEKTDPKVKAVPQKAQRGKSGQFISAKVPKPGSQKAKESVEVVEKLDVIHDDLVEGEKDQKKRDKKMMKAVAVGAAGGGGLLGGLLNFLPGGKGGKKGFLGKMLGKGKGLFGKGAGKAGAIGAGALAVKKGGKGFFGKMAGKFGMKGLGKVGAKGIGKSVLKKIPGIGLLVGLGFGAHRLIKGDALGALGEAASGLASIIPGLGTAVSISIDASLAARDVANEAQRQVVRLTPEKRAIAIKKGKKAAPDPFMKKAAIAKEAKSSGAWEKLARMSASLDRSPKIAREKAGKEVQKQIDASNKELASKTDETNKLLKELLKAQSMTGGQVQKQNIPNGISNQSDITAIKGFDEY